MRKIIACILVLLATQQLLAQIAIIDTNYVVLNDTVSTLIAWQVLSQKSVSLSAEELQQVSELARNYLHCNFSPSHKEYTRQLVPVINSKGEKEVWINCFCGAAKNWQKVLVIVDDGGDCFFSLKVNLSTKKCYDLVANGNG